MTEKIKMNSLTKTLVIFVIIVHFMFFVLEAVFWMRPEVYTILIDFLNNPVKLDYPTQAITLRNLFINQGFYNLFLTCGGLVGVYHLKKGNYVDGYTLILFLCFAGVGAGIILSCSTKAYVLAILQALPAALAFFNVYPLYSIALKEKTN